MRNYVLAFVREEGAITNQDYRQLNGTDTLAASAALRGLRDLELLSQKEKSNGTYYVLNSRVLEELKDEQGTPQVRKEPYR